MWLARYKKLHPEETKTWTLWGTLFPPNQQPQPDDIETRLQRLESLKEKNLLTDAEYQAKREEILGEV